MGNPDPSRTHPIRRGVTIIGPYPTKGIPPNKFKPSESVAWARTNRVGCCPDVFQPIETVAA